jgi:hypothetical protein
MPDETTNDEITEPAGEDEGQEPSTTEANEPDPTEQAENSDESSEADELTRDDAVAALAKVRKSEAKTRTRLRELEAQFKDAKTPEEVQEIIEKLAADNAGETRALLVENVALKHGLPDELRDVLKGNSRDELEAHAVVLKKYAPTGDDELEGGLTPGTGDPSGADVADAVKRVRANRY